MPKRIPRGTIGNEMSRTKLGALFIRARSGRPLRLIEEMTGVNRETWRLIELGITRQPGPDILQAAGTLPGGPTYEDFRSVLERDILAAYPEKAITPQEAVT